MLKEVGEVLFVKFYFILFYMYNWGIFAAYYPTTGFWRIQGGIKLKIDYVSVN